MNNFHHLGVDDQMDLVSCWNLQNRYLLILKKGRVNLLLDGKLHTFLTGDSYHIGAGTIHSGKIYADYAVTVSMLPDSYATKK